MSPDAARGSASAGRDPAAADPPAVRRHGLSRVGPKGQRTRAALLQAAHDVFVEHGYGAATVAQIAGRAGCSLATYYQYFADKAGTMAALAGEWAQAWRERDDTAWRHTEGADGIRRVVERFVREYAASASFQAAWHEASHTEPRLAALRRGLTTEIERALAHELRRGRRSGVVRAGVDPARTARALTAMAERYCYVAFVDGAPAGPDAAGGAIDTLVDLWTRAVLTP